MQTSNIKVRAKQHLVGNWGLAIAAMLVVNILNQGANSLVQLDTYDVITLTAMIPLLNAISFISIFLLPLSVGYARLHMDFAEEKESTFNKVFSGFTDDYGRNLGTLIVMTIFLILWFFVFIIPVFIKALAYAMTPFILADPNYKNLTITETITKSRELMDGHKMELFGLIFSIIWWIIPLSFVLGILMAFIPSVAIVYAIGMVAVMLYLGPYVQQVTAEFYKDLTRDVTSKAPSQYYTDPLSSTDEQEDRYL